MCSAYTLYYSRNWENVKKNPTDQSGTNHPFQLPDQQPAVTQPNASLQIKRVPAIFALISKLQHCSRFQCVAVHGRTHTNQNLKKSVDTIKRKVLRDSTEIRHRNKLMTSALTFMSRVSVADIATCYGMDGPGIESRCGASFSAPFQTGHGAHPASCTMGTASFPAVKRPGRGVDHQPTSSAEVKERV